MRGWWWLCDGGGVVCICGWGGVERIGGGWIGSDDDDGGRRWEGNDFATIAGDGKFGVSVIVKVWGVGDGKCGVERVVGWCEMGCEMVLWRVWDWNGSRDGTREDGDFGRAKGYVWVVCVVWRYDGGIWMWGVVLICDGDVKVKIRICMSKVMRERSRRGMRKISSRDWEIEGWVGMIERWVCERCSIFIDDELRGWFVDCVWFWLW